MAIAGIGFAVNAGREDLSGLGSALDGLEALKADFAELPLFELDLLSGGRILKPRLSHLVECAAGRPLRYTLHAPIGLNFLLEPVHLPLHFDVLRASLDVAAALEAVHVVVHTGFCERDVSDLDARYARQREWLARAGDEAAARNLVLCVENIFPFSPTAHTALPSRLAEELCRIAHPAVCGTLDISHGFICANAYGADPVVETLALACVARHVHLHDSFGRSADAFWTYTPSENIAFGLGDLHLPLGWGAIPFDRLMAEARFLDGAIVINELPSRFWGEAAPVLAETRRLAALVGSKGAGLARAP